MGGAYNHLVSQLKVSMTSTRHRNPNPTIPRVNISFSPFVDTVIHFFIIV